MKKLFIIAALLCGFAANASAQLYLGGGLGFGTNSQNGLTVKIAPEIGYGISSHFTVGGRLSYQSGSNLFGVDPYFRVNVLNIDSPVRLMLTLHAPVKFASDYLSYGGYLQPGLSVRMAERVRLEGHIGAFGWGCIKYGNYVQSGWEAVVNGNTISVGVVFCL